MSTRLRQKLAHYNRTEGADDLILVDVPKGGFRVIFEARAISPAPVTPSAVTDEAGAAPPNLAPQQTILGALLAVTAVCALVFGIALWRPKAAAANRVSPAASPERSIFRRAESSFGGRCSAKTVSSMVCLGSSHGSTGVGTASTSFLLGQFLSHRKDNVLLTRSDLLSTPELIMDNVVFLGPATGNRQIPTISTGQEFVIEPKGIRNLHPQPGEPSFIAKTVLRSLAPAQTKATRSSAICRGCTVTGTSFIFPAIRLRARLPPLEP